jgi:GNAT superfamily N-acetyltransferase
MFQIKLMREQDFLFATKLANTMGWNMAIEDFKFNKTLEPRGCFVALDGRERVGVATCISFGKVGWFGSLIIKEKYRGQGVGSFLVKHAVAYLQTEGVKTIGIYAYPYLSDFYGGLGFKQDEEFSVLHAQTVTATSSEKSPAIIQTDQVELIERFDSGFFGANRKKVLAPIILEKGNLGYFVSDNSGVVGYVGASVYWTMPSVGPMICKEGEVDAAASLLKAVLGKLAGRNVYAVVPKKQELLMNMLFSAGFREAFSMLRMFFGQPVAKNCIYMAESLERG